MTLEETLNAAIAAADCSKLPQIRETAEAELSKLRGRMSKNYLHHMEALLAQLEEICKKKAQKAAKPVVTGASNFFS